jgi:hypothetical protein
VTSLQVDAPVDQACSAARWPTRSSTCTPTPTPQLLSSPRKRAEIARFCLDLVDATHPIESGTPEDRMTTLQ